MRKIAVYITLVLYLAIQLRPVTAIVGDLLAHTFWYAHHLATEHHEHGHEHLHDELAEIDDDHDHHHEQQAPSSIKIYEENLLHLIQVFDFRFLTTITYNEYPRFVINQWDSISLPTNSPPPKS